MFDKNNPYNREVLRDNQFRYRTTSLFLELNGSTLEPIFNIKYDIDYEFKGKIYYSLKKLYLALADPTEYIFASTYLYDYAHWKRMCSNQEIAPYVDSWREELELKLRANAIQEAIALSKKGNYNAAKWLADRGWEAKRGRPTKAEKEARVKQDDRLYSDISEDLERIGVQ